MARSWSCCATRLVTCVSCSAGVCHSTHLSHSVDKNTLYGYALLFNLGRSACQKPYRINNVSNTMNVFTENTCLINKRHVTRVCHEVHLMHWYKNENISLTACVSKDVLESSWPEKWLTSAPNIPAILQIEKENIFLTDHGVIQWNLTLPCYAPTIPKHRTVFNPVAHSRITYLLVETMDLNSAFAWCWSEIILWRN